MTGIVFGNTFERAEIQLNKIAQDYKMCHIFIEQLRKRNNSLEIIFDNGDIWRARAASESIRGIRCNVAYIDKTIPLKFANEVIKPLISAYPFQAYKIFSLYEGEDE